MIRIGLPDASAGATLCATRFSGKLNGVMPRIGPIGKPAKHAKMRIEAGRPIERNHLSRNPSCLFGRHCEGLDGSADFPLRVGNRLARLGS